jgi:hypothetical protein
MSIIINGLDHHDYTIQALSKNATRREEERAADVLKNNDNFWRTIRGKFVSRLVIRVAPIM